MDFPRLDKIENKTFGVHPDPATAKRFPAGKSPARKSKGIKSKVKTKITIFFGRLRSSYWFLPSIMTIFSSCMAIGLITLDIYTDKDAFIGSSWIRLIEAAGVREILSTTASSMITVTGVVFSITIVSLSLASQQFGPRLLQNFMRDRGNQFVLGTVTSTFLYCLLVLGTVSEGKSFPFVPRLSALVAVALAVLCVGVLIYFIHHTAESIQVTNVITAVSRDLGEGIERLFPDKGGQNDDEQYVIDEAFPEMFDEQSHLIPSLANGYLQAINISGLVDLAEENDLLIRARHRIGHFVVSGAPLVEIWSENTLEPKKLIVAVNDLFVVGNKRSQEQDIGFLVNELVEIAVRALSPGINDPFTANTCIDHLGAALCRVAQRENLAVLKYDRHDRPRVILYPMSFDRMMGAAFNQIRQNGRSHTSINIRLLENIKLIIPFTSHRKQREALLRQADMIERGCRDGVFEEADRRDIYERYWNIFQEMEKSFGMIGLL